MPNFSRETFKLARAPRTQKCSCGCGQTIVKTQLVHVRAQEGRGHGENRLIDLEEHYRAWLDQEARKYAANRAAQDRRFAEYLGGRR